MISPERLCPTRPGLRRRRCSQDRAMPSHATASCRFSRPAPTTFGLSTMVLPVAESFSTPRTAVFTIAERTSADVQSGCWSITTAADPATCGVAIDVPWKNAQHDGVVCTHVHARLRAEDVHARSDHVRLDAELHIGRSHAGEAGHDVVVRASGSTRARRGSSSSCRRPSPSARARPRARPCRPEPSAGSASPSDAIAVGSPATLLTTSTAAAPASCAFRIFSENVQTPREISAISPVRLPAAERGAGGAQTGRRVGAPR